MYRATVKTFVVSLALGALPVAAQAAPLSEEYDSLWIFGDSLSDTGNADAATNGARPGPAYFDGRWSDGPIWSDIVAEGFLLTANFAFGGAEAIDQPDQQVPSLNDQIGLFSISVDPLLLAGSADLAAIWIGANDLLQSIGDDSDGLDSLQVALDAAQTISDGIQSLSAAGIDDFLVFNLPDLGSTPFYQLVEPFNATEASDATVAFNDALAGHVDDLQEAGLSITEIDMFALFNDLLENPDAYGVTETMLPCLFGESVCTDADLRAFYDFVHPTSAIHAKVADEVVTASTIPVPASLGFLLLGLAGLGVVGRRRAA